MKLEGKVLQSIANSTGICLVNIICIPYSIHIYMHATYIYIELCQSTFLFHIIFKLSIKCVNVITFIIAQQSTMWTLHIQHSFLYNKNYSNVVSHNSFPISADNMTRYCIHCSHYMDICVLTLNIFAYSFSKDTNIASSIDLYLSFLQFILNSNTHIPVWRFARHFFF